MCALFNYPIQAKFGRIVAKSKIYDRVKPSAKIKEKFISQVGKIIWQYKLAPQTTNLPETDKVKEIEIFELQLRTAKLDVDILYCIDKAIVHPIIFYLTFKKKKKIIATYKRPNLADSSKWVLGDEYFATEWLPENAEHQNLPAVLDLSGLYEHILREIIPLQARENESLESHIERMGQVIAKDKMRQKLEALMNKEKQFNRRVKINAELRELQNEIKQLKGNT